MLECHSKNLLQLELNKEIYTKHEASLKFVDGEGGGYLPSAPHTDTL